MTNTVGNKLTDHKLSRRQTQMLPKGTKIIVIDFEATCWESGKPHNDDMTEFQEIIEIGYAVVDTTSKEIVANGGVYIKPQRSKVSDYCFNLTGITQEKLDTEGVDSLDAAFEVIKSEIGSLKKHTWGSWGSWDFDILRAECRRLGVSSKLSRYYLNLKALYSFMYFKEKYPNMTDALKERGLPLEGRHHSGKDDAYNLARLVVLMLELIKP